ncbi:MAG: hypothetical protein WA040_17260 [Anaerolineae bacterium]
MKSRYQGLRGFGTLALIIAWILLILGILAGIGAWLGINSLATALDLSNVGWSIFAAIPGVLFGLLGFIQFYIIGKVLHLLVDLDNTTLNVQEKVQSPAASAASGDAGAEISGELKRQAKLIASNLEATQSLQQQIGSLQARAVGLPAPTAASVKTVVEETVSEAAE